MHKIWLSRTTLKVHLLQVFLVEIHKVCAKFFIDFVHFEKLSENVI